MKKRSFFDQDNKDDEDEQSEVTEVEDVHKPSYTECQFGKDKKGYDEW